ncbi:hypothetical protein GCM10022291_00280 [Postechiella marina]|uniref:DUF4249 domain-containing protein n=1 Tax=Postechiella marina TaxID=943941 RepID=A0ABP8BYQ1_9FLAO
MKIYYLLLIVLFGCENNNVILSDELTVEGQILEGEFARINLTNSLPFSGVIDSMEVARSMEAKAKVELSDGEISEILTLKRDDSRFPYLYYRSNIIKGELNKQYNLSVTIRGKEFKSITTIPEKVNVLDVSFSTWEEEGVVEPDYKDINFTIENNTDEDRYFKILIKNENEKRFEFARPFIFNTENISTNTFPLIVSYIKFNEDSGEKENHVRVGEVLELKIVSITKEQFYFWKSIEGDVTSPLEDSSFSNAVVSNISNGAFGYWSGESVESFKFEIPE